MGRYLTQYKMPKPNITSFGEFIRQLREEAELPLRKAAEQLDIDPSFMRPH